MKYYATITHSLGQFEIGGTKASLIRDLKAMRRSKKIDGLESIRIYAVDLKTGARRKYRRRKKPQFGRRRDCD